MRAWLLLLPFFLISCASTGEKIENINKSLVSLQRLADRSLPLGKDRISRNGREFYSIPFATKDGQFVKADKAQVRRIAVIKVLGDRRPYTMAVVVMKEYWSATGQKVKTDYDQGLARVIKRRIQKALYQRREELNIIDDFKAF